MMILDHCALYFSTCMSMIFVFLNLSVINTKRTVFCPGAMGDKWAVNEQERKLHEV